MSRALLVVERPRRQEILLYIVEMFSCPPSTPIKPAAVAYGCARSGSRHGRCRPEVEVHLVNANELNYEVVTRASGAARGNVYTSCLQFEIQRGFSYVADGTKVIKVSSLVRIYTPTEKASKDDTQDFYNNLSDIVKKHHKSNHIVMCGCSHNHNAQVCYREDGDEHIMGNLSAHLSVCAAPISYNANGEKCERELRFSWLLT
ncbi:hypothetical protein EVAR_61591_1 [Eumeta japonica]|uniref:Uncharacterized protein n=1 Tax=Eumeta variegata TaxID=151549 RepID=A0A4C1YGS5_EUMVA|nr:hypothetical protein EVAR_61591_1 [Eumeta japonica]